MKWVTYQSDSGERAGVLSRDTIHPAPPGVTLLELVTRGADGLRRAGEAALRSAADTVPLGRARLLAPIPRPPSIRDSLCFLDHMRNCQPLQCCELGQRSGAGGAEGEVLVLFWSSLHADFKLCQCCRQHQKAGSRADTVLQLQHLQARQVLHARHDCVLCVLS